jgi:hypothetical protein
MRALLRAARARWSAGQWRTVFSAEAGGSLAGGGAMTVRTYDGSAAPDLPTSILGLVGT